MSQFDSYVCDPQVDDLIPAGLDDLLQEIHDGFDYEELDAIPPAEDLYDPEEEEWEDYMASMSRGGGGDSCSHYCGA